MEKILFREVLMIPIEIHLEPDVLLFYTRIACTVGKPLEQVLSDALYKLAAELALEALKHPQT